MNVTVSNPVNANAGSDLSLCVNSGTVQLPGLPTGGIWSGSSLVTPTGVFTASQTGTYSLVYSVGSGTCLRRDTMNLVVNSLPVVSVSPSTSTLCIGSSATLSASGALSYTWSPSGSIVSNLGNTVIVQPTVNTTYTIQGVNAEGCINNTSSTIIIAPLPTVTAGADQTLCNQPVPVTLAGIPLGGSWSGTSVTNGGVFTPNGVGTFPIVYTYTNTNSCINSDTMNVTVSNPVNANAGSDLSLCVNSGTVQLPGLPTGGVWSGSSLVTPTGVFTASQTGTYSLVYSVGSGTCLRRDTMNLVVNSLPVVSIFPVSPAICVGGSVSITAFGAVSYSWTSNSTLSSINGANVIASPISTNNSYTVNGTDINGCTNANTFSVTIFNLPLAAFVTNVNMGCSPLNLSLNNLTQPGTASSYEWDFGDGTSISTLANPISHVFTTGLTDSIYQIKLIAFNACGSDTVTYPVTVKTNSVTAFFTTSALSGCSPQPITFTSYASQNTFVSWAFGDGNVSTQTNPVHLYTGPGTYTCNQYVNNGCGFDTASVVIQIYPSSNLSFSPSASLLCVNQNVSFTNTSTNIVNTVWNFGDGTSSNLFSPVHSYTAAGTYTVTLTGTSSLYGCITSSTLVINVGNSPVTQISSDVNSGCNPLKVNFSNISTNTSSYSWNFGDGNTSNLFTPSHIFNNSGTFTVSLVVYNSSGCSDTASMTINVLQKPFSAFQLSSTYQCQIPATVNFTNTSIGAIGYNWDFGDGTNSINNNPSVTFNTPGDYIIKLISTAVNGCSDTSDFVYKVLINPTADFEVEELENCKPEFKFNNSSLNADQYAWNFGDGFTSDLYSPQHMYETYDSSKVTLIAYNSALCSDTVSKIVSHITGLFSAIYIPNAFTPNNDGLNDLFEIKGFNNCEDIEFKIYNRWGEVIFKTNDINDYWDGTYQGQKVEGGVYVYELRGETFERRGAVTVIYYLRN
jgi:gliding motility-associated-like protein